MNPELLVGADKRIYVKKVIGPPDAPFFETVVPANDSDLPKDRVSGKELRLLNFPKISMHTMNLVHAYFAAVYEKHRSEAMILFHRAPGDSDYTVVVPESYTATSASLSYEHNQPTFCTTCRICSTAVLTTCPRCGTETMQKTVVMGTAHSHGSMDAFHSGTDDAHEKNQTGFHITFGHVNRGLFSVCPSFVVALAGYTDDKGFGTRYYPELSDLVEIPDPLSETERTMVDLWTSVLFNESILTTLPADQLVAVDETTGFPLFTSINPDYVRHWSSAHQELGRSVLVHTASQIKEEILKKKKAAELKSGSVTTLGTAQPPAAQAPTSQPTGARQLIQVGSTRPKEVKASGKGGAGRISGGFLVDDLDMDTTFEFTSEEFGFKASCSFSGDIEVHDKERNPHDPWKGMNKTPASAQEGMLITMFVMHVISLYSRELDNLAPRKTIGFPKSYDDALGALSTSLKDLVGGGSNLIEEMLDTFTFDGGTPQAQTVLEVIQNRLKFVRRVVEGSISDSQDRGSILAAAASHMLIIYDLEKVVDLGSKFEVLEDEHVDLIQSDIDDIMTELGSKLGESYSRR